MGVKWRSDKASSIFKECLDKKYYPKVFRVEFDSVYIYCEETGRIWRITGEIKVTTLKAWKEGGGKEPFQGNW